MVTCKAGGMVCMGQRPWVARPATQAAPSAAPAMVQPRPVAAATTAGTSCQQISHTTTRTSATTPLSSTPVSGAGLADVRPWESVNVASCKRHLQEACQAAVASIWVRFCLGSLKGGP